MNDPRIDQRRRKVYMLAREVGLDDGERIELACTLLQRDIRSWKDLDDGQVQRLLDALSGYQMIAWTVSTRAPR